MKLQKIWCLKNIYKFISSLLVLLHTILHQPHCSLQKFKILARISCLGELVSKQPGICCPLVFPHPEWNLVNLKRLHLNLCLKIFCSFILRFFSWHFLLLPSSYNCWTHQQLFKLGISATLSQQRCWFLLVNYQRKNPKSIWLLGLKFQ